MRLARINDLWYLEIKENNNKSIPAIQSLTLDKKEIVNLNILKNEILETLHQYSSLDIKEIKKRDDVKIEISIVGDLEVEVEDYLTSSEKFNSFCDSTVASLNRAGDKMDKIGSSMERAGNSMQNTGNKIMKLGIKMFLFLLSIMFLGPFSIIVLLILMFI